VVEQPQVKRPFRASYASNPKLVAILLVVGDKTGGDRWYEVTVPIADRLYDAHLEELKGEAKKEAAERWLRSLVSYVSECLRPRAPKVSASFGGLFKLREARHLTQTNLATVMGISQSEVSKIERRADVYVSTLGSYIEATAESLKSARSSYGGVVKIN
jgi:DNA-binding transcriptional regulator YiaG